MATISAAPTTFVTESWIAGRWKSGDRAFDTIDPSRGTTLTALSAAGPNDVDAAVTAAAAAYSKHTRETAYTRAGWARSAAAAIRTHAERLAVVLSSEHGKPLSEARAEVGFAANGFDSAADAVLAAAGHLPHVQDPHKRVLVRRTGIGVWAVITPWNFPVNIPVEYIGPGLVSGNAVIWKPAPTTSAVAAEFRRVLLEADFPQELLQLVLTDDVATAQHLVTHPGVVAVGFTGGSTTGQAIAKSAWDKHLLLELGGNSPIIVLPDADIERAAEALGASAFFNAGQVCSAAGKILTTAGFADELSAALAEQARGRALGAPLDEDTNLGPVHLAASIDRFTALVDDAVATGAEVLAGGKPVDGDGYFYPATVLTNVPASARIFAEETFGPVASISPFPDEDQLLAAANAGEFGLVGAIFTSNVSKAFTIAEDIDCGLVVVNDTTNYWDYGVPFGGAAGRLSGRGRLGSRYALDEFTQVKAIAMDIR
jgi:succinate-semialdehyde dehydrogenase/glutarate-semialdehyde dehydrogenase